MMGEPPLDPCVVLADAVTRRDAEAIVAIILHNLWHCYNHDYNALRSAVSVLDEDVLREHPVLWLLHPLGGVAARTGNLLDAAVAEASVEGNDPLETALFQMVQIIAARVGGDIARAVRCAQQLAEWTQLHHFSAAGDEAGPLWLFHHQIGSTYLLAGDTVAALRHLGIGRQIGLVSGSIDAQRSTAGRIAIAHAARGSLIEADRALEDARALGAPSPAYRSAADGTERAAAALIGVERLDADAEQRVLQLDSIDNFEIIWPYELLARTRLCLALGEPERALEQATIAATTHHVQAGSFAADVIDAATIEALLSLGDLSGAGRQVTASQSRGPLTRLAAVQASIELGDTAGANADLHYLSTRSSLSPLQRAQLVILTAQLETMKTGGLTGPLAAELARTVARLHFRRLATTIPAPIVPMIRAQLSAAAAAEFDDVVRGLSFAPSKGPARVLTEGERRVLAHLATHDTNAGIAAALHVSPNTVKTQLRSLYRKLGVGNRRDALAAAHVDQMPASGHPSVRDAR